jgi:hypothetical protein
MQQIHAKHDINLPLEWGIFAGASALPVEHLK